MTTHVPAIAQALAEHLPGWCYKPTEHEERSHVAYLRHESGAEAVLLCTRPHLGRLEIHGVYPRHPNGTSTSAAHWDAVEHGAREPSITVAITRPPPAIAADFERRFAPWFLDVWRRAHARWLAAVLEHDAHDRRLEALMATADDAHRCSGSEHRAILYGPRSSERTASWRAEIYVSRYGVDLDIRNLGTDTARAVLELISARSRTTKAGS